MASKYRLQVQVSYKVSHLLGAVKGLEKDKLRLQECECCSLALGWFWLQWMDWEVFALGRQQSSQSTGTGLVFSLKLKCAGLLCHVVTVCLRLDSIRPQSGDKLSPVGSSDPHNWAIFYEDTVTVIDSVSMIRLYHLKLSTHIKSMWTVFSYIICKGVNID